MPTTSSPAPIITAAGLADIFTRLVPLAFESGFDVDMRADFPEYGHTVLFGVACTPATRGGQDAGPILDAVRSDGDTIAARLLEAQQLTMLTGKASAVNLDCLDTDPSWPVLKLSVEPTTQT